MSEEIGVQQWLESKGIEASAAERYAQALAHPDVDYNSVSQLITINENRLISAGVSSGRHRDIIMENVQDLKQRAASRGLSTAPQQLKSSLALPMDFFSRQLAYIDFEGLKATPWALKRDDLCHRLCDIVNHTKRLLVRGPFGSGKTAVAQLLHYHLRHVNNTVYIITLSGYSGSWEDCWFRQTGVEWDTVIHANAPVYVIIDEVQRSYPATSSTHDLWGFIKNAVGMEQQVRYICIGSYGDPEQTVTPHTFPLAAVVTLYPHNGTPGLAYTQEEFGVLCQLFKERGGFEIDERSANYIYHMTGGHPGITGWVLGSIHGFSKTHDLEAETVYKLYDYLHSANFHYSLRNGTCRAIPNFAKYQAMGDVCRLVLNGESFKAQTNSFGELNEHLQSCLKASILVEDGDYIAFASPVIQDRALGYYFSEIKADPVSLDAFIVAVVQRFSSRQLLNTEGRDTRSRIMEGEWQHEFSRAAASLLPNDACLSSEYGREQGVRGQVDFYIAKYQWLLEVLRDGIALAAHERRFQNNGQYTPLLAHKQWAVIDFRSISQEIRRDPQPHTYHVSFTEDFAEVMIRDPEGRTQRLPLLGDQALATHFDRASGSTPAKLRLAK